MHTRKLARDLLRMPQIVGIDERKKLRTGLPGTRVASSRGSTVGLPDQPYAGISLNPLADPLYCAIRRAIIDDHHLEIRMRLGKNARDGAIDGSLGLVGWNDDPHKRLFLSSR
jgi:hypothetical protein